MINNNIFEWVYLYSYYKSCSEVTLGAVRSEVTCGLALSTVYDCLHCAGHGLV